MRARVGRRSSSTSGAGARAGHRGSETGTRSAVSPAGVGCRTARSRWSPSSRGGVPVFSRPCGSFSSFSRADNHRRRSPTRPPTWSLQADVHLPWRKVPAVRTTAARGKANADCVKRPSPVAVIGKVVTPLEQPQIRRFPAAAGLAAAIQHPVRLARVAHTAGPLIRLSIRKWMPASSAASAINPPSASISDQVALGEAADRRIAAHLPERLERMRQQQRRAPMRAAASAASAPAWPPPTTMTSNGLGSCMRPLERGPIVFFPRLQTARGRAASQVRQVVFEIGLADADEAGLAVEALEPRLRRDADAAAREGRLAGRDRPRSSSRPSPVPRAEPAGQHAADRGLGVLHAGVDDARVGQQLACAGDQAARCAACSSLRSASWKAQRCSTTNTCCRASWMRCSSRGSAPRARRQLGDRAPGDDGRRTPRRSAHRLPHASGRRDQTPTSVSAMQTASGISTCASVKSSPFSTQVISVFCASAGTHRYQADWLPRLKTRPAAAARPPARRWWSWPAPP